MGIAQISGSISAGPASASSGIFPTSSFTDMLSLGGGSAGKSFQASGASPGRTVASPSAYVTIADISSTGDVTEADTLYLRTDGDLLVELTTDDGSGGDVVAVIPVSGLLVAEFTTAKFLKGLRVKGTARITYFVSGPQ